MIKHIPASAIGAFIGSRMFVGKQSCKIVAVELLGGSTQIKVEGAADGTKWYEAKTGFVKLDLSRHFTYLGNEYHVDVAPKTYQEKIQMLNQIFERYEFI